MTQPNYTTEHREALREQILKVATREFTTIGVKSVKMDDIARKLKISKRTLYPKSVIRISLCRTAKRNPLIFPI